MKRRDFLKLAAASPLGPQLLREPDDLRYRMIVAFDHKIEELRANHGDIPASINFEPVAWKTMFPNIKGISGQWITYKGFKAYCLSGLIRPVPHDSIGAVLTTKWHLDPPYWPSVFLSPKSEIREKQRSASDIAHEIVEALRGIK